jgi:predicted helicase
MLIQHILTERLIREIFDNPEFVRRNVIAAEVEKVMLAMTSHSFDRNTYLRDLDRFYVAIEHAARTMTDWSDKQYFLNTVYERFFQGYSVKLADTMGIVYTPQEIVDFMCASVAEVLETEFGKKLWSDDVYIIDPCTGTGNFIVNLIRRIPKARLADVYKHRLFANEIMLLPYYIAALNIEHAYWEQTGKYEGFEGLCFVDTLDLADHPQQRLEFMTAANTERVERQRRSPITVIIGNPPYNARQQNENDNNKNRKYPSLEVRIRETYVKGSGATNKNALDDPYVKFFRWAADRLQEREGVVCFISNNGFVHKHAYDGVRKHLLRDFTQIYHIDLHGDRRRGLELTGTSHNVFGIPIGVGITVAIRRMRATRSLRINLIPEIWKKEEKLAWLSKQKALSTVAWDDVTPDDRGDWLVPENADEFSRFVPTGIKVRSQKGVPPNAIFAKYTAGVVTSRDDWAYDFSQSVLADKIGRHIESYNAEVDRWRRRKVHDIAVDQWVLYDDTKLKWSRDLKVDLADGRHAEFNEARIRRCLYRPFTGMWLFYDDIMNEETRAFGRFLPHAGIEGAASNLKRNKR